MAQTKAVLKSTVELNGVYDTVEMYQKQIKMKQTAPARMRTSLILLTERAYKNG
jgi:hypothetical protein